MFNKSKQSKIQTQVHQSDSDMDMSAEQSPPASAQMNSVTHKPSIISEGAVYEGDLSFSGILHLDGQFKGNIRVDKLTIGKNGRFTGKIVADAVTVFGDLKGELDCRDLALNSGSSIDGAIHYVSIKIQPGASVSGILTCVKTAN